MLLLLIAGMSLFFILLMGGYYIYKNSEDDDSEDEVEDDDDLQNIDTTGGNPIGQSDLEVDGGNDNSDVNNERSEYTGGGLEEAPPMSGEEETVKDESSQLCKASLCNGGKVLISNTIKGDTEDKCCRDKYCSEDWDPGKNPSDPCRQFGMKYNKNSQWNGNSKEQCCEVDTTSYSKWCVQRVARKPDGTFEKTRSPIPYKGGHGFHPRAYRGTPHKKLGFVKYVVADVADWEHHTARSSTKNGKKVASALDGYQFSGTKASNLNNCKNKCDEYEDCGGFLLTKMGKCFLKKPLTQGDLFAAYELNNKDDSSDENAPAHEFYIKSTMVPENMRYQTINGQVKIAGIDEEYCPFDYTSIYGVGNWHDNKHFYGGAHEKDDTNTNIKCYGPGGKHHGVTLMTKKNSTLPIVKQCSKLCDAVSGCEGFWADLPSYQINNANFKRIGRCCLKGKKTFTTANTKLRRYYSDSLNGNQPLGSYFVKVKNGKMGIRSWRKSPSF